MIFVRKNGLQGYGRWCIVAEFNAPGPPRTLCGRDRVARWMRTCDDVPEGEWCIGCKFVARVKATAPTLAKGVQ